MKRRPEQRETRRTKSRLRHLGVRPTRTRGQNFVVDPSVMEAIVAFGRPRPGERLIEIGPGLGALTEVLRGYGALTVIEIEARFCTDLSQRFPDISIINADAREVDFASLGEKLVVFGNLPYSFSTELLSTLLDHSKSINRAVLLLQREFAERLAAAPGGRDYGTLSVGCQMLADVIEGPIIPGDAFHPPTAVESMVVELIFLDGPRHPIADAGRFRKMVRAAFSKRRKIISNSMRASGYYPGEAIDAALAQAGIDPGARAEALSGGDFAALFAALESILPPSCAID